MAAIKTLRALLSELRIASPNGCIKNSAAASYVLCQFKKYQTTDLQNCKGKDEMLFLGNTYLCYVQSVRKQKEINKDYAGRGEMNVKDTANMVGFKLPNDPRK